jgi:hypothetical protein
VPYLETGQFTPIEKVQVFAGQLTQTIHYNDATNQFALGPL